MTFTKDTWIRDIINADYRTALILINNGIDTCCNYHSTLEAICTKKGIDCNKVLLELEQLFTDKNSNSSIN